MRRILENYFKILGGIDLQYLWERFEGEDAVHCKSLISWVNDGSHFAHDDLYVVIDETMVNNYLKVFFKIFKQMKHMRHYQMMMGEQYVDLDPDLVESEADPELNTAHVSEAQADAESLELLGGPVSAFNAAQETLHTPSEPVLPLAQQGVATDPTPDEQDPPLF